MSGQKFAALVGVNYQTFATWVQRRRKAQGKYPPRAKPRLALTAKAVEPLRLLEAVVEKSCVDPVQGEPLRVPLPGGGWVEVGDGRQAALAAELLRALATRGC